MSKEEFESLYFRSLAYQFAFFFTNLISIAYIPENSTGRLINFILAIINAWLMLKTLKEYKRKRKLYKDNNSE
jgi:hypothetical protein